MVFGFRAAFAVGVDLQAFTVHRFFLRVGSPRRVPVGNVNAAGHLAGSYPAFPIV